LNLIRVILAEGADNMGVLEGKVALVTGGSRGVGAAIARSLAREGAAVVVNYLKSGDKGEEVVRSIRDAHDPEAAAHELHRLLLSG
jgi:NAD(P)-dependent dehydrogenase (short-subunit alcohol dehydrogenase family)